MKDPRAALLILLLSAIPLSAAEAPPAPALFRITLLGTGNPRPSLTRFGPSILVEAGGKRILVDAGRGVTERLMQVGVDSLSGIDLVLLTHLHSDHVVGLPDLWLTGWIFGRATPLLLRGPAGTAAMAGHLEKAFEFDVHVRRDVDERFPAAGIEMNARDLAPGEVFELGPVRVTSFVVDHGVVAPAFGYRIDAAGRSAVFSGDTRPSPQLVEIARGCDVLVHEVIVPAVEKMRSAVADPAKVRRIIQHHTTPEDAGRIFTAVKPRLAVYSHIVPSPATAKDIEGPTRKTYSGPLAVGEDLMTITVGTTIEVGKSRVSDP